MGDRWSGHTRCLASISCANFSTRGRLIEAKPLAAYVAFKGQHNPEGLAQNTTVWPVQKFNWRDLTLRKKRSKLERREEKLRVRYCIRAVGHLRVAWRRSRSCRKAISTETLAGGSAHLRRRSDPAWLSNAGVPYQCHGRAARPQTVHLNVHQRHLSTQFIVRILEEDGEIKSGELEGRMKKPDDFLRNYLAGEVFR